MGQFGISEVKGGTFFAPRRGVRAAVDEDSRVGGIVIHSCVWCKTNSLVRIVPCRNVPRAHLLRAVALGQGAHGAVSGRAGHHHPLFDTLSCGSDGDGAIGELFHVRVDVKDGFVAVCLADVLAFGIDKPGQLVDCVVADPPCVFRRQPTTQNGKTVSPNEVAPPPKTL